MAIPPTNIQILFTNYDIITYFLNLASCSEHFISIKHRILATFNIKQKNSILTACMPLRPRFKRYWSGQIIRILKKKSFLNAQKLTKKICNLNKNKIEQCVHRPMLILYSVKVHRVMTLTPFPQAKRSFSLLAH